MSESEAVTVTVRSSRDISTSTVTTASVPPVMASTWYESSWASAAVPSADRTAAMAASTGPLPVPEATRSSVPRGSDDAPLGRPEAPSASRSTDSRTDAVGVPLPEAAV